MASDREHDDWTIDLPWLEQEYALPADEAVAIVCQLLDLPVLGGPSGRGFSYYEVAMRCPELFRATHDHAPSGATLSNNDALAIGIYFHALLALHYAGTMGDAYQWRRGLLKGSVDAETYTGLADGRPHDGKVEIRRVGSTAAETFGKCLTWLCKSSDGELADVLTKHRIRVPSRRPSLSCVLEAIRLYESYQLHYDDEDDLESLAVEWWAKHPDLEYTCRYDHIARLRPNDLLVRRFGLRPHGVIAQEHKTAKWLAKWVTDGWFMDGEILGQLMCWGPSGCEERFGPLEAVVVNIITKEKTPKVLRIVIPPTMPTVVAHQRWMQMVHADILMWRATGIYPQRWTACWDHGQQCVQWDNCLAGNAGSGQFIPASRLVEQKQDFVEITPTVEDTTWGD